MAENDALSIAERFAGGNVVCRRVPNRSKKRTVTAKAVGRMVCAALEAGESEEDIEEEIDRCLRSEKRKEKCDCERQRNLIKQALSIAAAIALLLVLVRAFPVVITILARLPQFLLPLSVRAAIPNLRNAAQQLPNLANIIEGEFTVLSREALKRGILN